MTRVRLYCSQQRSALPARYGIITAILVVSAALTLILAFPDAARLAAQTAPPAAPQPSPLHQRIDQQIAATHIGPLSSVASDADFLRRVYLDLHGTIPTAAETRAFLADAAPDKRAKKIDQLLASPLASRHLANVFDVMLMERRGDKYVPAADWQKYLYDSFIANKPYDQLVRELLTSDGVDPATRSAAKFTLEREAEPNLLTRDVGRIFLGRDLQCAQCHDHPLVDDYYQIDYYALYSFFNRTQLFTQPDKDKKVVLMDGAGGEVSYQSVFNPQAGKGTTLPRVPGGKQVEEQRFNLGDEWAVAPAKDVRQVPKYSRRLQLAGQLAIPANRQFNRNIVNRLWAQMLGVGLVEPVDFQHLGNPPTHPQLLELLADEFAAMKYDVKAFLREVALSQTYQRALDLPPDAATSMTKAADVIPALEAESAQLDAAAQESQKAWAKLADELTAARKAIPPIVEELNKAAAPAPEIQKAIAEAQKALTDAQAQLAGKQDAAKALGEAAAKAKEAAAKLPEEKDLMEAAAKFQARTDQLLAEVAALPKAVEEKTAAVKAATDKLPPVNQALTDIYARLDPVRKQVFGLEEQADLAAAKRREVHFQEKSARRKLAEAKAQAQYAAALAATQSSQAEADKLAAELSAAQANVAKLAAELPTMVASQPTLQQAKTESQSAAAAAKQLFDAQESTRATYAEVFVKSEAAAQKLPQDAELQQTVQKLKARSEQLTAAATEAQKAFAAKETAAQAAAAQLLAAEQAVASATAQSTALAQSMPALETKLVATRQQLAAQSQSAQQLAREIPTRWSRAAATHALRQLSPEQLAWSILRATGVTENTRAATAAEIEKATPLPEAAKADPAQLAARQQQVAEATYVKLAPNVATFVQLFGSGAGQPQSDFFATVDQALFLANGGVLKSWLAPGGENLTARLLKLDDPKQLSEELYLSVLTRLPDDAEAAEVAKYLAARPQERPLAVQELVWSLISSAEFRFNR